MNVVERLAKATWANILPVATQAKLDVTLKALTQILLQRGRSRPRQCFDFGQCNCYRPLRAKPEKIIVDIHAASPNS